MNRLVRAAAAGALMLSFAGTAVSVQAADEVSDAERSRIEGVVRDYLLKNPEIVQEALVALEKKQEAEKVAKRKEMMSENSGALFESPRQVVLGNPDGKITVVEFFDYNCGVCRRGFGDMMKVLKENQDVKFVLKEFPILGRPSQEAARVAIALHLTDPDKYLDFHTAMFALEGGVNEEKALMVAENLGVDMDALKKNMDNPEIFKTVEEVYTLANGLGLTGTPSYVVGTEVFGGLIGYEQMSKVIASMRECGETSC